jgi:hypothetical protein
MHVLYPPKIQTQKFAWGPLSTSEAACHRTVKNFHKNMLQKAVKHIYYRMLCRTAARAPAKIICERQRGYRQEFSSSERQRGSRNKASSLVAQSTIARSSRPSAPLCFHELYHALTGVIRVYSMQDMFDLQKRQAESEVISTSLYDSMEAAAVGRGVTSVVQRPGSWHTRGKFSRVLVFCVSRILESAV